MLVIYRKRISSTVYITEGQLMNQDGKSKHNYPYIMYNIIFYLRININNLGTKSGSLFAVPNHINQNTVTCFQINPTKVMINFNDMSTGGGSYWSIL